MKPKNPSISPSLSPHLLLTLREHHTPIFRGFLKTRWLFFSTPNCDIYQGFFPGKKTEGPNLTRSLFDAFCVLETPRYQPRIHHVFFKPTWKIQKNKNEINLDKNKKCYNNNTKNKKEKNKKKKNNKKKKKKQKKKKKNKKNNNTNKKNNNNNKDEEKEEKEEEQQQQQQQEEEEEEQQHQQQEDTTRYHKYNKYLFPWTLLLDETSPFLEARPLVFQGTPTRFGAWFGEKNVLAILLVTFLGW